MNIKFNILTDISTSKQLSIMEECIKVAYKDKKITNNKVNKILRESLISNLIISAIFLLLALILLNIVSIVNFIVIYIFIALIFFVWYKWDCKYIRETLSYTKYVKNTLSKLEKAFDKKKNKYLWTNMNNFEYFKDNQVTFHSITMNKDGLVKLRFAGNNGLLRTKRLHVKQVALDPEQKEKLAFYFESNKVYATLNEETYKTFSDKQTIELTII